MKTKQDLESPSVGHCRQPFAQLLSLTQALLPLNIMQCTSALPLLLLLNGLDHIMTSHSRGLQVKNNCASVSTKYDG